MATLDRSDEAARVIDLLGRLSLRLWMLAADATRAGNDRDAAQLNDLVCECDDACVMLTPLVAEGAA